MLLHKINYKTGDLRSQYAKIVGDKYKKDAYTKTNPVLPEIFIQRLKMFQPKCFDKNKVVACCAKYCSHQLTLLHNVSDTSFDVQMPHTDPFGF